MKRAKVFLAIVALAALGLGACAPAAVTPAATLAPTATPPATIPAASPTVPAAPTPTSTPLIPTEVPVTPLREGAATPGARPWQPLPSDAGMARGSVFIDDMALNMLESMPVQVELRLIGSLPTPCHHLRVDVSEPNAKNRIDVEVYSLTDPNLMCIQVLHEFDESFTLGTYPVGTYSVYVNGQLAGEFTQ
jgi:hypothetical protein